METTIEQVARDIAEALSVFFNVAYLTEIEKVEVEGGVAFNLTFTAIDNSVAKSIFEEGKITLNLALQ